MDLFSGHGVFALRFLFRPTSGGGSHFREGTYHAEHYLHCWPSSNRFGDCALCVLRRFAAAAKIEP